MNEPQDHAALLRGQVEAALVEFPPHVVRWAYEQFFMAILPFAAAIMAEQELTEHAKACGLTRDEALEGSILVAALKGIDKPAGAMRASELVAKFSGRPELGLAFIESKEP